MPSNPYESEIKHRLEVIRLEIERACQKSERLVEEVQILAISKKQSVEVIRAAYDLGIHSFGESYLQEAQEKWNCLPICQIFIGRWSAHSESKSKRCLQSFDRIHSLDSIKLADLLSKHRPANLSR